MTDTPLALAGRVALVTGGAQGIGAGICEGLVSAGAAVAIVDLQRDKAERLASRLKKGGGRIVSITADIATARGCRSAVSQSIRVLGGFDILVNNAAPGRNREMLGKIAGVDWTLHEKVVLQAVARLTEAALPHLTSSGKGVVVNVSSAVASSIAIDHCSWPYHVSKAGLNQLTRWLASLLGPRGIRVNAVAPGLVDRDVGPKLSDNPACRAVVQAVVPLRRAGRASDIAQSVVFLCSEQAAYITGQVLTVDGGLGLEEVFGSSLRASQASGLQKPAARTTRRKKNERA